MQSDSLKGLTHWWGKIIGGAIGLAKGGLWGMVFGAFVGHLVDRFIQGIRQQGQVRQVFFRTLFGALGHLNKADGRVTEVEIATAENLMRRLELKKDERQAARAVRLLSPNRENDRSKLVRAFEPALSLAGDVERGRTLYRMACAVCHRAEEFGNVVGPVPATFQNRGREWISIRCA